MMSVLKPLSLALGLQLLLGPTAWALPQGWKVISGQVNFAQTGSTLTVTSTTQKAIVEYISFNLASGETVNFILPGASAGILNRVTGGGASFIAGKLSGNGQIGLVNTAGIAMATTAQLQAANLLLSTLNLSDPNFLAGTYTLENGNDSGIITNAGLIQSNSAVVLAASEIQNTGSIFAPNGQIHLAVGDRMTLHLANQTEVEVVIDEALKARIDAVNANIDNKGVLSAKTVTLQTQLTGQLLSGAINNEGVIEAAGMSGEGGTIRIYGAGNDGLAIVDNSGLINASGENRGGVISIRGDLLQNSGALLANSDAGHGGSVEVLGQTIVNSGALIDVSGQTGGGSILVGGDLQGQGDTPRALMNIADPGTLILADALNEGSGGKVIFWADESTRFSGLISARGGEYGGNGGFAEVSGKGHLNFAGHVDLLAPQGTRGTLLLDPTNIIITDFSPLSLNPVAWYDGNDSTTLTLASGRVSQWSDKSTSARHATQGTANSRPLYTTDSLGRAVLRFDGGDSLGFTSSNFGTQNSIFVVSTMNDTPYDYVLLGGNSGQTGSYGLYLEGTTMYYRAGNASSWNFVGVSQGASTGTMLQTTTIRNGTTVSFFKNGSQVGSTQTMAQNTALSLSRIGSYADGTYGLRGDVGEIIIFNTNLSTANRQALEQYLEDKWLNPTTSLFEVATLEALSATTNIALTATNNITINNLSNNLLALGGTASLSMTATNGSITFNDVNDMIRTEGRNITLSAGSGMTLGRLNTTGASGNLNTGNITLSAGGNITAGNLDVNTGTINVTTTGGGSFGTSGTPISTDASAFTLNTAGNAYISNARAVTVSGTGVGGNFQLRNSAAGNITVNNLDVVGTTDIQALANSNSTIGGTGNIFRGTATINTNDSTGGHITLSGDYRGSTNLTGDQITVTDTAGNFTVASLSTGATGTSTIRANAGNLSLAGLSLNAAAVGRLDASASGSVSINGAGWTTTGDIVNVWSTGGGDMTLSNSATIAALDSTVAGADPNSNAAGVHLSTNGGAYTLNNNTVSGVTNIQARNTITGTGNTFTGNTTFDANLGTAYSISLTNSNFASNTNVFDGSNLTIADTNALTVSSATATGTASFTATGAGNALAISNASIAGATTLTSGGAITATDTINFGTLTATGNGAIDIYETGDMNINSVTNTNATAATTLYSMSGSVLGKGNTVADVISNGTGQVAIVAGSSAANTGSYTNVHVNSGGTVYAMSSGRSAGNLAVRLTGDITGPVIAGGFYVNSFSFVPSNGNLVLGDSTDMLNAAGTTSFSAGNTWDVTGLGSYTGAVSGTAGRIGIEAATGNFTSGGLTAASGTGWYGAADESMIILTRNGDILGSGYTVSGAGNIRLQAGTATTLNTANNISVNNVSTTQNLALYATGANAGNSITVGGTSNVGGHITATNFDASYLRSPLTGGVDITLSSGNLTTASISALGTVNLTASAGSILQNASVYAGMNDRTIRANGDVSLTAGGGYINTGVGVYGIGSDLLARASSASGGNSVNLVGRVDGNLTVTNLSNNNVTGAVHLGSNLGSINDLDDVTTVMDVGGNTLVKAAGAVNMYGGFGLYNGTLTVNGSSVTGRFDRGTTLNLASVTASAGNIDLRAYNQARIIGGNLSAQDIYLQAGSQMTRDKMSYINLTNVTATGNLNVVVVGSTTGGVPGGQAVVITGSVTGSANATNESGGPPRGSVSLPP